MWFKDNKKNTEEPAVKESKSGAVDSLGETVNSAAQDEDVFRLPIENDNNMRIVPDINFSDPSTNVYSSDLTKKKEESDSMESKDTAQEICDESEESVCQEHEGDCVADIDFESEDAQSQVDNYYKSLPNDISENQEVSSESFPEIKDAEPEPEVVLPEVKEENIVEQDYAGKFYREQILAQKVSRKETILYMACGILALGLVCLCIVLASVLSSMVITKGQNEFISSVLSQEKQVSVRTTAAGTEPSSPDITDAMPQSYAGIDKMFLQDAALNHKKYMERMGITDPRELVEFDSFVSEAIENTNHPILVSIFSPSHGASMEDISDTYKIWSYIMTVRQRKIDISTALLEAASLVKYSKENKIPLSLSVGVAQTESRFNISAMSNKNALGPMQVVYNIHKGLLTRVGIKSRNELFTADKGIMAGCFLLGRYVKTESNITGGLKKYYGALSPKYISSVLNHRHAYELFASGMTDNPALAISKEQVNWAKMSAPQVPVYKKMISQPQIKNTGVSTEQSGTQSTIVYKNTGYILKKDENGNIKKLEY